MYILKSKINGELYIGSTNNIKKRLEEHNSGKEKATKRYKPWTIAYLEGYFSQNDARNREHNLKHFGKVYSQLKRRIKDSLQEA